MNQTIAVVQKESPKPSVLKEILDRYAEDTVTDEQVQRVLLPVLKMIRERKFDKPPRRRFSWLIAPLLSMAAVAVLIITVAGI